MRASSSTEMQVLLIGLKKSFLQSLPEKLDELEKSLLKIENSGGAEEFNELFRGVHSLKGSGGTFGLHVITAICHKLEDFITIFKGKRDRRFIDESLLFIDLMRDVVAEAENGHEVFPAIENRLNALWQNIFATQLTALVALNSKLVREICGEALKKHNIRFVEETSGLTALNRAATEHFDLIIVSSELPLIKGEALIGAMKLSQTKMEKIQAILVTTRKPGPLKRFTDPDYTITLDEKMQQSLEDTLTEIVTDIQKKGPAK